ncbi:kinase-like domain-containing protein [Rhizophagus irregularis DAOM 181602=DAOM 197198]|uniref:Kinase-like domain-containing protein n=1 Tax=Rhizophagus irregularis (strain DAOM 181602 / DAOM 197198 / MUCL 43194) TaxID=747089 RepID=A0A2P4NYG9_RHIID|nr:kinase-like domain-containing protein [Rhizophagus irregularis DAOM 181602=DAOM 197198]POG58196.1 kinase-like domain-containing protein [Rhizophagus irregularis DAOM 181602=DAOM 197198]|eukprot:XP_025165062.1 kinase-like domain-containing protein [Rhizophagus irregularis DAOM 181602=DAOM 197198]
MQYADGSNLQKYLKDNFKNLTWDDKKKLAFQIAEGLNYLHNENILHRDLHSKNILIHEHNAKITDFGISKIQNDPNTTVYKGNFGVTSYMEPKRLLDENFLYTKSSDIYSFGVLMWEISSGYPPFKESDNNVALACKINDGVREDTIPDTPKEYEKLYKNCWNQEPEQRPIISEILDEFEKMGFGINIRNESIKDNENLTSELQISTEPQLSDLCSKL